MFKTLVRMVIPLCFNELNPNEFQIFPEEILWFIHIDSC